MARRLMQRTTSQEEINGSFDSIMSFQTYLGEDTFPDIPENHEEALGRVVSLMSYLSIYIDL